MAGNDRELVRLACGGHVPRAPRGCDPHCAVGTLDSHMCSLPGSSSCARAVQVGDRWADAQSWAGSGTEFPDVTSREQMLARTVDVFAGEASAAVARD